MTVANQFVYVDFATRALRGFRNNIVHVRELGRLAQRYGHTDCFCTYFLFDRGLLEYVKGNGNSVAGYQGPCLSHYLPLDIDSPDIGTALGTARDVTRYLLDDTGLPEQALAAYYSGMKGFHLYIDTGVFGQMQAGAELPSVFREVRRSVVEEARVKHPEAVDYSICDRLRLLRLPNTRHSKSGLYKVPLKLEELLYGGPYEIINLARKPRGQWLTDESGLMPGQEVGPVPDAVEMLERCAERAKENQHSDLPDPRTFLSSDDIEKALCHAELELYREGVPEGARSAMCLRLASRFRSAGYTQTKARGMVESFAARCRPPLEARTASRIVQVAYRANGRGYQFGCGTGVGDPLHTSIVYEKCPYTDRRDCGVYARVASSAAERRNGGLASQ